MGQPLSTSVASAASRRVHAPSPDDEASRAGIPLTLGRAVTLNIAVAAAYVVAAALGFRLAFVAEQITTVWAPTGIALAVLYIGGHRFAPAIWVGALIANFWTEAPRWTAFIIASGNTLEAVAAVWWLRRLPRFEPTFRRIGDVLAFVLVAAAACTAISATVGVAALALAGAQSWSRFPVLWFDWWLGDALGAVVVAPAILTALNRTWSQKEVIRASAWIAGSSLTAHVVFGQVLGITAHPIEYVIFPLVIAAAVTGGPGMTAWVVLSTSVVAIWHTVNGAGPFASPEVHQSLILLQAFMGVLAGTSLLLAASVAERRSTEQREHAAAASLRHRQELLQLRSALAESRHSNGIAGIRWRSAPASSSVYSVCQPRMAS